MFGRGSIARDVAVLAGGAGIGHMFSIAAMPIASRLYSPTDFGKLELYLAFMNCSVVVCAFGYERAVIAATDRKQAACLTVASILLSIPIGFASAVAFYALTRLSVLGYGNLPSSMSLWVPAGLFLTCVVVVLRNWYIREGEFQLISRVPIYQNVLRATSQIAMGLIGAGWTGLLSGDLLGRSGGVLGMIRTAWWSIRSQNPFSSMKAFRSLLWEYRKFPKFSLPSSLINAIALVLPLPLIAANYGVSAAGEVGMSLKAFALPSALIASIVADVFHNRIARYQRERTPDVLACFWQTARGLLLIGLGPSLIIILFAPTMFGCVFGSQWTSAGVLTSVMAPWILAQLIVSPLSRIVEVFGRQEIKLVYDCVALLVVMIVPIARYYGFSLVFAVAMLTAGKILAYALYFYLLWGIARISSIEVGNHGTDSLQA